MTCWFETIASLVPIVLVITAGSQSFGSKKWKQKSAGENYFFPLLIQHFSWLEQWVKVTVIPRCLWPLRSSWPSGVVMYCYHPPPPVKNKPINASLTRPLVSAQLQCKCVGSRELLQEILVTSRLNTFFMFVILRLLCFDWPVFNRRILQNVK